MLIRFLLKISELRRIFSRKRLLDFRISDELLQNPKFGLQERERVPQDHDEHVVLQRELAHLGGGAARFWVRSAQVSDA